MPAGALAYQSDGDIIFYRAREVTTSVSPQASVCALVGARTIRFSGMAGSVVHLLEQPRPGCDRVLPHSPEPNRGAGRADRNEARRASPRGCDAKGEGPGSARLVCRERSILRGGGGSVIGGARHGWKPVRVLAVRPRVSMA